ncbi:MAG: glycoside hydrolase family 2 protein, partial [Candidatus Zipacnadales bacterium]
EYVGQMQDVHGPWQYQGPVEQYTLYNRIDPLLHSEFGVEGAANIHSIRRFASEEHLWPPDEMNPLWLHHGAWWVQRPMMERVFGPLDDLRTYVMASQFLQAEGLRYACESHRRRKWHCGGTMPWQFNESWPNLSCTNSVDFYGHPRPAYWWVKLAYEPFHVSAKYDKLCWRPGEEFTAEGWINNSLAAEPAVEVSWDITDLRGNELASGQSTIDVPEGAAIQAGSIRWTVSEAEGGIFVLRLHATTPSGARSTNWYIFGCAGQPVYAPLLKAPRASLAVTHNGDTITVENRGDVWALFVRLEPADGESWFEFNQNYVLLARGEKLDVLVAPASSPVVVSGWNFEEQTL